MTDDIEATHISLDLEDGYRFMVDLGDAFERLAVDEPPPLGAGGGPNASALLVAAVANCLSASLLYCLRRAHVDVTAMHCEAKASPTRNAEGRLRIGSMRVVLQPVISPGTEGRVERCLELFENFCVVTESVRAGIGVSVEVDAASKRRTVE
ncbi:MAG: OsmC family protein [Actinomycetota bacterium]|nr:OsmC family protein [Actinomycetota bacterium]